MSVTSSKVSNFVVEWCYVHSYHRFRWYATLENKTPADFRQSRVLSTDRIEIHQLQPLLWPDPLYVMLAGCDWWISIRSVDNVYDWRKFWKRFRVCFVFQSRVSTKTVVSFSSSFTRIGEKTPTFVLLMFQVRCLFSLVLNSVAMTYRSCVWTARHKWL